MIKEYYFPTPIYLKDLNNNLHKEIEKKILQLKKDEEGIIGTNVNGWHSSRNMHLKKEYLPLIDELMTMQKEIYLDQHLDREPKIGNMWANINYKEGYNRTHTHPNSVWSGVYYVKTSKNSGNLYLEDPRPGSTLIYPKYKPNNKRELWKHVSYTPKNNRIIMFPGWLPHGVESNFSDDIRISVSFNFIQK